MILAPYVEMTAIAVDYDTRQLYYSKCKLFDEDMTRQGWRLALAYARLVVEDLREMLGASFDKSTVEWSVGRPFVGVPA